ncbi:MAG: hypothetical protein WA496_13550, partial [Candidatus Udaeobacter sp.]
GIETLGATARTISNQGYAKFYSRSHDAVIRVYDKAGNVIETHKHGRDFKNCEFCSHRVALSAKTTFREVDHDWRKRIS